MIAAQMKRLLTPACAGLLWVGWSCDPVFSDGAAGGNGAGVSGKGWTDSGMNDGMGGASGGSSGAGAVGGSDEEMGPLRAGIVAGLARRGDPVYVFLPELPSVRLRRAGGGAPADSAPR